MAGLLAPEDVAAVAHRLEDVAVADRGLDDLDPLAVQPQAEAEVRHDRRDDRVVREPAVLAQGEGQHGQDLVAVDDRAVGRHGEAPVGVAVEGDAEVGALLDHGPLERLQVGRPAAVVDVPPVRFGRQSDDRGAGPAEHLGSDERRRPVGAVQRHGEAGERGGGGGPQVVEVVLGCPGRTAGSGRRLQPVGRSHGSRMRASTASSSTSSSLTPPRAKNFSPLSGIGLCDADSIDTEVGAGALGEVGDGWRGQDAHVEHVDAGTRQPGRRSRREELPRRPPVATDDCDGTVTLEGPEVGEDVRSRDRQVERELGRQVAVGQPTDTVGAEQSGHGVRAVSAWSTAEPCGPS